MSTTATGARTPASSTVEHWLKLFAENGIPAGEVRSLDRVYSDPQVLSQGLLVETDHSTLGPIKTPGPPLRFDRSGVREHRPPPTLGEHSEAIRAWLDDEDAGSDGDGDGVGHGDSGRGSDPSGGA